MAAKIVGNFVVDEHSFPFTGIAFGRIGGQNIGVKLTDEVEKNIKDLGYDLDVIIDTLQKNLIQGDLTYLKDYKKNHLLMIKILLLLMPFHKNMT